MSDRERSMAHIQSRNRDRRYSRRSSSSSRGGRRSSRHRTRSRIPFKYSRRYSRSRSRCSRSRSRYSRSRSRYSRSRSRSRSYDRRSDDSRSPRHNGKPDISALKPKCLGVFGLSIFTKESEIRDIFSRFGTLERVQVIFDAKTGKSRGYCFVYFANHEDAKRARDECSGMELDDRRIRVDFSITQRAHSPTPGVYMGKPTKSNRPKITSDRGGGGGGGSDRSKYREDRGGRYNKRRSPSPYRERRKRYDRSRSRSYSPRSRRYR